MPRTSACRCRSSRIDRRILILMLLDEQKEESWTSWHGGCINKINLTDTVGLILAIKTPRKSFQIHCYSHITRHQQYYSTPHPYYIPHNETNIISHCYRGIIRRCIPKHPPQARLPRIRRNLGRREIPRPPDCPGVLRWKNQRSLQHRRPVHQ